MLFVIEEQRSKCFERFDICDAGDGKLFRLLECFQSRFSRWAEVTINGKIR